MEWPSVMIRIPMIVMSSLLFFAKITSSESMNVNYVNPFANNTSPCSDVQRPCLTLNKYASNSDDYFVNNTRFYFYSGIHWLNYTLIFENLHNISFQGWPSGDLVVTVIVDSAASITWNESWNIKISSIKFTLNGNFIFIMRFEHSQLVRLSNVSIYGNGYNGCSSIISEESALEFNDSKFIGINGFLGAALMIFASNITFTGRTVFSDNTAASGGSIYLTYSTLTLKGAILFLNNTSNSSREAIKVKMLSCNNIDSILRKINLQDSGTGGGAMTLHTCSLKIQGNASFVENKAYFSHNSTGGAMLLQNTNSSVSGNLFLRKNLGRKGGALSIIEGNFIIKGGYTLFESNYANYESGALYIISRANFKFCGRILDYSYSAIGGNNTKEFDIECSNSTDNATSFNDSIIFLPNTVTVTFWGGFITCENASITFIGTVYFNKSYDSAIKGYGCNMSFIGTTHFYGNSANDAGGAIMSFDSNLTFTGTAYFEGNVANHNGGAIALRVSKLIFKPNLNIFFILNNANKTGGALYIRDSQCSLGSSVPIECFMTIDGSSTSNISLHFINNSAGITGSTLYGGQLDWCRLYFKSWTITSNNYKEPDSHDCNYQTHGYSENALETFMSISNITQNEVASISSTAKEIKFCEHEISEPLVYYDIELYPGQQFIIPLIALGQTNSPVPAKVLWEKINFPLITSDHEHHLSPSIGKIDNFCTNVSFWLYSSADSEDLDFKLYPDNPCQNLVKGLTLSVYVRPCPVGFDLSPADSKCVCAVALKKLGIQSCYIAIDSKYQSVERTKNTFWISKKSNEIIILHKFRCPLDYCTSKCLNVTFNDPSAQCDFNRTGIVCGQCMTNYSVTLGSLHCIPCNNIYIALIVPFALTGIALVALIFLLQLTVSVGTLNGLFFYANIIQANHQAFFPRAKINFFTIFISWLNLDLGIETCFYDGMDIYAYSWFQFLFPFYVWFLVGCIILACRYSQSIAKRFGQNPVAVLATLLLMSYSKILQAIIVPLSWTYLVYYKHSNESQTIVWLYDASMNFFCDPKHTVLGLFSILSLVVFALPYIFLLLFGQWLQGCSNWWILSWLNRLKPVMDAYHAPYTKDARYWTGLLLLSRLGLFLTFAINTFGSNSINILAVSTVSAALLALKRKVYENWAKDILESSFILNLCIFSVATFYLNEEFNEDINSLNKPSFISIGVAFTTFIGILLYHISLVLNSINVWKNYMLPFTKKSLLLSKILRITPVKDQTRAGEKDSAELQALPTSTEINVDLREPLLEITESQAIA